MTVYTREQQRDPITFQNAPTEERDGVLYFTDEAAAELGRQVAARYATLLARLADE